MIIIIAHPHFFLSSPQDEPGVGVDTSLTPAERRIQGDGGRTVSLREELKLDLFIAIFSLPGTESGRSTYRLTGWMVGW